MFKLKRKYKNRKLPLSLKVPFFLKYNYYQFKILKNLKNKIHLVLKIFNNYNKKNLSYYKLRLLFNSLQTQHQNNFFLKQYKFNLLTLNWLIFKKI